MNSVLSRSLLSNTSRIGLRFCSSAENASKHFLELVPVKTRSGTIDFEELKKKALLVYFSAGWCGSCRQFTPKLKDFYEQTKDSGLEVVWVSRDKTAEDQMDYYNQNLPPWLYIEYGKGIRDFLKVYEIKTIPAIKLVDVDGNVIDDGARAKIESPSGNPSKTLEEWKKMLKI
ncbi:thioredoxin-like domain-containing protein [Ditylenchus destructor]|uniref:protein-disulfide reductase n=1 Tax=Ditylenchus destructor TaxID=166010 RepID=A0AAD4RDL3_9BILA|nr:thioredoxin-like domain-containing protein [Ditylenchus destructor]